MDPDPNDISSKAPVDFEISDQLEPQFRFGNFFKKVYVYLWGESASLAWDHP